MTALLVPSAIAVLLGAWAWVLIGPSAPSVEDPPSAPARTPRADELDLARMIERLSTVLGTGAGIRDAWAAVARSLTLPDLAEIARAASVGGDPRDAAPAHLRERPAMVSLSAALHVCERTGAPAARVLQSLADALRELHEGHRARRSAFAGPRSTARILLVLPLAGLGLGMLLGGDPLHLLIATTSGRLLALAGAALTLGGWWWMRRMLQRADSPAEGQVDASVLLELISGALSSGLPLARAAGAVADALEDGPDAQALRHLSRSLAAGIPAATACSGLPGRLAALEESAVLAEASGADLVRVLRSAAKDLRSQRAQEAQEAAATLGVALVLPTGVTLLPAFVLLGIVPTVISLLGGAIALTGAGAGP